MENSHLSWSILWIFQLATGEFTPECNHPIAIFPSSFILETLMLVFLGSNHPIATFRNENKEKRSETTKTRYRTSKRLMNRKNMVKYQTVSKTKEIQEKDSYFCTKSTTKVQRSQTFGRNKYMLTFEGILHIYI